MSQNHTPKQVAVIGLGKMGSALAEALLSHDFQVAVWNRTLSKCVRLKGIGATVAGSVAEAAHAADLMIVCLTDHAASCAILMTDDVANALERKTLVQVSTVTMQQSRELADWAGDKRIEYLDGVIAGIPQRILDNDCIVVYSGSQHVFEAHTDVFAALGGGPKFVGECPGTAPALDAAMFSCTYSLWLGYFHGAAICHAVGLPIEFYVDTVADTLPTRVPTARRFGEKIAKRSYEDPGATLEVHAAAFRHVVDLSEALGIDAALPKFMLGYFERGLASGYSQQELSALFELMINKRA